MLAPRFAQCEPLVSGDVSRLRGGDISDNISAGYNLWSGPRLEFVGSGPNHLRIRVNVPWCNVQNNSVTVQSQLDGFVVNDTIGPQNNVTSLAMNPFIPQAITTSDATHFTTSRMTPDNIGLTILSSCFTRYRCVGPLRLHYMPAVATTDQTSFALNFTQDVFHPIQGARSYSNSNQPPTYTTIKQSMNSLVFASWAPWSAEFDLDGRQEYYMNPAQTNFTGVSSAGIAPVTDESRLCFFGMLNCCAGQTASPGSKGELYIELMLDLVDFTPNISGITIPTLRMALGASPKLTLDLATRTESKEAKTDEDDLQPGSAFDCEGFVECLPKAPGGPISVKGTSSVTRFLPVPSMSSVPPSAPAKR